MQADAELDAIGLECPLPVLKARKRLSAMRPGARLLVLATDPMAAIDLPHLCTEDGHTLLSRASEERHGMTVLAFLVERGPDRAA